jgi:hypothetical protein
MLTTIAIPGRPRVSAGDARPDADSPGPNSRSNTDRTSIGEAAGVHMAMPPLQKASERGYAPRQIPDGPVI